MSTAVLTIADNTNTGQTWVETSPNDPETGSLSAYSATTLTKTADNGPWTVSFSPANTYGVVSENDRGTTATVTLNYSNNKYTVSVT